jgi:hypothetical protein
LLTTDDGVISIFWLLISGAIRFVCATVNKQKNTFKKTRRNECKYFFIYIDMVSWLLACKMQINIKHFYHKLKVFLP